MAQRGVKPAPTSLKLVKGEKKKSRLNENELQPDTVAPTCPAFLSLMAKAEWKRMVAELEPLGLMTKIDRAALAAYCDCYARWAEASEMLQKTGLIIKTPNDYPVQNPVLPIINKALAEMKGFLTEFGMTPSSRTRVSVPKQKPKNPYDDI